MSNYNKTKAREWDSYSFLKMIKHKENEEETNRVYYKIYAFAWNSVLPLEQKRRWEVWKKEKARNKKFNQAGMYWITQPQMNSFTNKL